MANEFPRAIVHVDGDAFFVACEVACNPRLAGKPVVTGADRGIASAFSYEAKALGIGRAMPIYEIKKHFPEVIIIPSHYRLYEIFSQRMYRIVQRFTPIVEWYSIDECFADITGLDQELGISYEEIAQKIKETLFAELGITFSVGLSSTKVLAKVASKWKKPNGLKTIPLSTAKEHLKDLKLSKVWGIGHETSNYLGRFGIQTVGSFLDKGEVWVRENCSKPLVEIWHELSGQALFDVSTEARSKHKSFSSTETFLPLSNDPAFIFSELSRHVEDVARKARREMCAAGRVSFFVKTRDFRYRRFECSLSTPTAVPNEILKAISQSFGSIFDPSMMYRASGVTLFGLVPLSHVTQDLFNDKKQDDSFKKIYDVVDSIIKVHGSRAIQMCSSLNRFNFEKTKIKKRVFDIPVLGKVH